MVCFCCSSSLGGTTREKRRRSKRGETELGEDEDEMEEWRGGRAAGSTRTKYEPQSVTLTCCLLRAHSSSVSLFYGVLLRI